LQVFYSLYFYLIVTTILLLFQALKEKEVPMVEEVPTETPSRDYHEIAMDVEVTKSARGNLTMSEGQDIAETVTGTPHDDAEQEERAEV
jgi:hypothetical protein